MHPHLLTLAFCVLVTPTWAALAAARPVTDEERGWLERAHRSERSGWIFLHVEGGPRQRGFQHGYLLAREIAEGLRATRVSWERLSALPWPWLVQQANDLFQGKIDAEILAELDGVARGMEAAGQATTRAELVTFNGWIELSGYWWPGEVKRLKDAPAPAVRQSCSAFIATGRMTKDGGIVLGHNTMMPYYEAQPNVILDLAPERGHRLLMQTWAGWVHSGTDFFLTDAGLVGCETTIGQFEGFDTNGIPEFVRMRRATQDAGSIDEWCALMQRGNNGGYANAWLLGHAGSGEIARLELGLKHVALEKKSDGVFLGSNVAEDLRILRWETSDNETDIRQSNVARRVRWQQLMARHAGAIDLTLARQFEADHCDAFLNKQRPGGRSLCGHHELEPDPAGRWPGVPFGPAGTLDAKVVDAAMAKRMSFAARWGAACGRPFVASRFLAEHPQFEWMREILTSRPSQPWVTFQAAGIQPAR